MLRSRKRSLLAADIIADWLNSPGARDLDRETIDRGREWLAYLREQRSPPPGQVDDQSRSDTHAAQALRSFLRNAYRMLYARRTGRQSELQHTVRDLVALLTNQHGEIQVAREAVHRSLHSIENELPENEVVKDTAATIRRHLRQLDTGVQQTRSDLNERLQSVRTRLLRGVQEAISSDGLVHTEASLEICFQSLCAAALLFGENVALVRIDLQNAATIPAAGAAARRVFRRTNDVVSTRQDSIVVLAIDTPEKHIRRLISELTVHGGTFLSPQAQNFDSIDEAIDAARDVRVRSAA